MRDFIYSLMTDKLEGPVYIPFKFILYLISLIYGAVIILRSVLYRIGIFKSAKVPLKVISVGNITLGGTGKTPFVVTLANILEEDLARNVCVLIRGYGWDEQAMLKRKMTEIPVLVGEDRENSAYKGIKLYGSDTAILDDGFQHWELRRDMDIVLLDSRRPFGNGALFPRGVLRETRSSLKRADIIILTKVDGSHEHAEALERELKRLNPGAVYAHTTHSPKSLYDPRANKTYDVSYVRRRRAVLLSSIGDPSYFESTAASLGVEVLDHVVFPDHHDYKAKDIGRVTKSCDMNKPDFAITTEKDAVKLARLGLHMPGHTTLILAVEIEFIRGKEDLVARLHSLYTG